MTRITKKQTTRKEASVREIVATSLSGKFSQISE